MIAHNDRVRRTGYRVREKRPAASLESIDAGKLYRTDEVAEMPSAWKQRQEPSCVPENHRPVYVLGFMFNRHLTQVVLIYKNRLAWQAGLLNGVGGHIENSETPLIAMAREFREETGCETATSHWHRRSIFKQNCTVYVFRCIADMDSLEGAVRTNEDQKVVVANLRDIRDGAPKVTNLDWLIGILTDLNPGDCEAYHINGKIGKHDALRLTLPPL